MSPQPLQLVRHWCSIAVTPAAQDWLENRWPCCRTETIRLPFRVDRRYQTVVRACSRCGTRWTIARTELSKPTRPELRLNRLIWDSQPRRQRHVLRSSAQ